MVNKASPTRRADKKGAPKGAFSFQLDGSVRRRLCAGADRARHAGAAKPAISERVLRQILLVVVLGEIELRRVDDLGGDRPEVELLQLGLVHALGLFRGALLLRRES